MTLAPPSRISAFRLGLVASAALFLIAMGAGPQAHAAEATVPTDMEAWYHITPQPTQGLPPASPYPPETLHIGVAGGVENARTYLTLDLASVEVGSVITGGILTLPVDPSGGTIEAESAQMEACLAPQAPQSVQGSTEPPPEIDCSVRAEAVFADDPFPHFTVDLAPFIEITDAFGGLRSGGVALMRAPAAQSTNATWHVALYAKDNDSEDARPITAAFAFDPPVFEVSPGPTTGGSESSGIDIGGSSPEIPSPQALLDPRPQPVPEPVLDEGDQGSTEAAAFEDIGNPYLSWVLLVPLLLLIFVGYFGRALTFEEETL